MNLYRSILVCVILIVPFFTAAIPAKKGSVVVMQPDGSTITIHTEGDEFFHYTLSDDNKLLTLDDNERYCYAYVDSSGCIVSTGVQACDSVVRPVSHTVYLTDETGLHDIVTSRQTKSGVRRIPQSGMGKISTTFPNHGDVRALVILVEYADYEFKSFYTTSAEQYFNDLMNKEDFTDYAATGSAKTYFQEMSLGKFSPQFDVIGPVKLSKEMSYYGNNDAYGYDMHPGEMVAEACNLVADEVNFSDYDNDGDGYCDNVYVIYAGYSEASSKIERAIWPHAWLLRDALGYTLKLDNVIIDRYACSSELLSTYVPDGIGTFVHEFSHVMGLPDLYHTADSGANYTPGTYSVMASGSYNNNSRTPPAYSSFERNAMGWIDLNEVRDNETITLNNLADTNDACLVKTSKDSEFFLFENRQQTRWDEYLPNHGMMIWHIDFVQSVWDNGTVNNNKEHQYVDIVKANNEQEATSSSIMRGWTWPGTEGVTEFSSRTLPAFVDWSGENVGLSIANIEEKDGLISFSVSIDNYVSTNVGDARVSDADLKTRVNGRCLCVYTSAKWIDVYNITGCKIAAMRVVDGVAECDLPTYGMYIVSDGKKSVKVMIR